MQDGLGVPGTACGVCGSGDVRTDVVEHEGWLLLGACPRCDHRWTRRLSDTPAITPVRVVAVAVRPEVANAA
jgi:hypothetical protein